ncbi:glycosyltransferase [Campylobacter armoricus]|uniref:glycosyltransferase n=1 Tax=Campylobacter armoricus TaxID=2505970 RepID=UPI0011173F10|nr:glycosyltransferase [Campylobacter armoricus]
MKYLLGILLAATKDSAFTIGTLLINIKDKMDISQMIFYIINDGFSQNDKRIMQELVPNIKFIDFTIDDFETNIRKFNTEFKLDRQSTILNRYTHMTYARFEALKFLKECESIIYLDFDMLLLKGIDELREVKNKGYDIACFRGSATMSMGGGKLTPIKFTRTNNYSAGIIVFNDNLKNSQEFYDFIYQFIAENEDYFLEVKLGDQFLFSLYLLEKDLKIYELDDNYYGNISWVKSKDASIIHAWGQNNRFWNNKLCALAWPSWNVYYQKWLSLGGSAYEKGFVSFLEVPQSGGEVFQYFEKIALAKRISQIKLEKQELIIDIDFNKKIKFHLAFVEDFVFYVYSKSIFTFILECEFQGKIIQSITIKRPELEKDLKEFITSNLNKYPI